MPGGFLGFGGGTHSVFSLMPTMGMGFSLRRLGLMCFLSMWASSCNANASGVNLGGAGTPTFFF